MVERTEPRVTKSDVKQFNIFSKLIKKNIFRNCMIINYLKRESWEIVFGMGRKRQERQKNIWKRGII